ncbi:MAG TPA: hypothetical protein VFJ58_27805 [Armatimonadota bacterium]|nr:hypothetical protein [Armatimonadota bacterium]
MMETEAARNRLMALARGYAGMLKGRPEIVGIAVYGSLSNGNCPDLTPFSDIDLALVFEGPLPAFFLEHRLFQGVKVDLAHYRGAELEALGDKLPYSLFQNGWVGSFLIKSLVLGRMDTILYDPTGIVRRVKDRVQAAVTYQELAARTASEWFHNMRRRRLHSAIESEQADTDARARRMANGAIHSLREILEVVANRKDLTAAAESLGIPEFARLNQRWEELQPAIATEGVKAIWSAIQAAAAYGWEHGYRPVAASLIDAGVNDPAKLELIGDFPLFWPGYRLHELGRVFADIDLSVRWSRAKIEDGRPGGALELLWNCSQSERFLNRWKGIQDAVQAAGYDVAPPVQALLADPEYQRLLKEIDGACSNATKTPPPEPPVEDLIAITQEMERLLAGAFPVTPPKELFEFLADRSQTSEALASALFSLELERSDAGRPEDFLRFSEKWEPAPESPELGTVDLRGPGTLRRWRLPAAAALPPVDLTPLNDESDWRLEDRQGSAIVQFREGGVDLTPAPYSFLDHTTYAAPLLLRDAREEFVLQAEVAGIGGLVAWKGPRNYVSVGWRGYPRSEIRFEALIDGAIDGENEPARVVIGRGSLPGNRAFFRLQRRGSEFAAWCSTDGENWHDCGILPLPLESPLSIGLYGLSFVPRDPAKVSFEKIRGSG